MSRSSPEKCHALCVQNYTSSSTDERRPSESTASSTTHENRTHSAAGQLRAAGRCTMAEKEHSCTRLKLYEARMQRTKLGREARTRS